MGLAGSRCRAHSRRATGRGSAQAGRAAGPRRSCPGSGFLTWRGMFRPNPAQRGWLLQGRGRGSQVRPAFRAGRVWRTGRGAARPGWQRCRLLRCATRSCVFRPFCSANRFADGGTWCGGICHVGEFYLSTARSGHRPQTGKSMAWRAPAWYLTPPKSAILGQRDNAARIVGAALAGRPPSRRQANQLLRPYSHADRLRRLSLLAGPTRGPLEFHNPLRTRQNPRWPMNGPQIAIFRTAGSAPAFHEEPSPL